MLLTKENLLRFVRERKYTLPIDVSKNFETSTIIASAALSELVSNKIIELTYLKSGGSPFYFDKNQKDCLIQVGEKYLSSTLKPLFEKSKDKKILNENHLSIQEKMYLKELIDFIKPLEINFESKKLNFYVWFLLDLEDTKKQILSYLKGNKKQNEEPKKNSVEVQKPLIQKEKEVEKKVSSKEDLFSIDDFIQKSNFEVLEKSKEDNKIKYLLKFKSNEIEIIFDGVLFDKKITQKDIIKFYTSSQRPKILFSSSITKSLIDKFRDFENFKIVKIS